VGIFRMALISSEAHKRALRPLARKGRPLTALVGCAAPGLPRRTRYPKGRRRPWADGWLGRSRRPRLSILAGPWPAPLVEPVEDEHRPAVPDSVAECRALSSRFSASVYEP